MLKAVVDTSVIVRGILTPVGHSREVLFAWQNGIFSLVTSLPLLEELEKVLHYPRLSKYNLTEKTITQIINNLQKYGLVMRGEQEVDVIKADPQDNLVLAAALESQADYIVTADYHLHDLKLYQEIPILWPGEFLAEIKFLS